MEAARVTARTAVNDPDVAGASSATPAAYSAPDFFDCHVSLPIGDQGRDIDAFHTPATYADAVEIEVSCQLSQSHTVYIYSNVSGARHG